MNYGSIVCVLLVGAIAILAIVLRNRRIAEESTVDPGAALMDFGTAFPDLAIRDVVQTADGSTAFLRLADGRTGMVELGGRRHVVRIIDPSTLHLEGPVGARALKVWMNAGDAREETFVFKRAQDAAEVSLWLCAALATSQAGPSSDESGMSRT